MRYYPAARAEMSRWHSERDKGGKGKEKKGNGGKIKINLETHKMTTITRREDKAQAERQTRLSLERYRAQSKNLFFCIK
jgi:hypothetical protein